MQHVAGPRNASTLQPSSQDSINARLILFFYA